MGIKSQNTRVDFTGYLPQGLLNVNSPTQSLAWETTTQLGISTGAVQGKRFYLSEATAQQLSNNTCHEGWYRIVQVDAGATANLIAFGYGGAMVSVANGPDVVTSADQVLTLGADPVVFLGPVTPGNFTIVQDAGTAVLAITASQNVSAGNVLAITAAGTFSIAGSISDTVLATVCALALAATDSAYIALIEARFEPTFGE